MDIPEVRISDMEAEIMKVVWGAAGPITYSEIRAEIGKKFDLKSQHIQSMVTRLVQKKVLHQEKRKVYYYSALVPVEEYIEGKTKALLSTVFDGNAKGLLTALIQYDEITPEDLDELRELWRNGGESV